MNQNPPEQQPLSPQFRRKIQMVIESMSCVFVGLMTFTFLPWSWIEAGRALIAFLASAACFLGIFQLRFPEFFSEIVGGGEKEIGTTKVKRTFAVPSRFGIRSIVFLTLVFALLSTGLKSTGLSDIASLVILGFVGLVAFAQVLLGKVPRRASIAIGIAAGFTIIAVTRPTLLDAIMCPICGALAGYLVGAVLATLFLFAGAVEYWWQQGPQTGAA